MLNCKHGLQIQSNHFKEQGLSLENMCLSRETGIHSKSSHFGESNSHLCLPLPEYAELLCGDFPESFDRGMSSKSYELFLVLSFRLLALSTPKLKPSSCQEKKIRCQKLSIMTWKINKSYKHNFKMSKITKFIEAINFESLQFRKWKILLTLFKIYLKFTQQDMHKYVWRTEDQISTPDWAVSRTFHREGNL